MALRGHDSVVVLVTTCMRAMPRFTPKVPIRAMPAVTLLLVGVETQTEKAWPGAIYHQQDPI